MTGPRRLGATVTQLSQLTGLDTSNITRRHDAAIRRRPRQPALYDPVERIIEAHNRTPS